MTQMPSTFEALREAALAGQLNRRDVLRRAIALGLSAPAIGALLAACGGDDDDDDSGDEAATEAESAATTEEATEEETEAASEEATEEETDDASETEAAETEEEATSEGSATEAEGGATGEWQTNVVDPLTMDMEFEEPASTGGTMIFGDSSDISTLNPVLSADTSSSRVISMIFEGLFETSPTDLTPVGRLATEWSASEDGLTWTIKLREGVTWSDGEPFTADDVQYSYEMYMNPDTTGPRASELSSKIESVTAIDDQTVEFVLQFVNADFHLDIANFFIIAKHIWEDVPAADFPTAPGSNGSDPSQVIGTGAFKFKEWLVEDHVTCIPNETFWGGTPALDEWIYRYMGDSTAVQQALKVGDIDYAAIQESSVAEFDGTDVGVHNYPTLGFTFYGTNMDPERTTLFQDVEVRQALMYALDRQAMIESIRFGYGEAAIGTMPVVSWAYNPEGIDPELHYEYDPEKAKQLLDDAGWVVGDDGVRAKDGQRLSFTMNTMVGDSYDQYTVAMQEFWREIGVEMTPELEPFPALVERLTSTFDLETFIIGFSWGATPGQETMWACDAHPSGFNVVSYCNPELDAIMQEALVTLDREKRIELLTQMQNMVLADIPMAVVDFPEAIYGISNRIHNLTANAINTAFNRHLWWVDA